MVTKKMGGWPKFDLNLQKRGGQAKKGIKNVFSFRVRNCFYSISVIIILNTSPKLDFWIWSKSYGKKKRKKFHQK